MFNDDLFCNVIIISILNTQQIVTTHIIYMDSFFYLSYMQSNYNKYSVRYLETVKLDINLYNLTEIQYY